MDRMTAQNTIPEDILNEAELVASSINYVCVDPAADRIAIARAILAERHRDQWQPIETAPKDGTYIMVGNEHGSWVAKYAGHYQSGFKPPNPWMSMMLNHRHMPHLCSNVPTRWMPLPAAPKEGVA